MAATRAKTVQELRERMGRDLNIAVRLKAGKAANWVQDYIGRLERRILDLDRDLENAAGELPANEPHIGIERRTLDPELARFHIESRVRFDVDGEVGGRVFEVRVYTDPYPHLYIWSSRGIIMRPGGASNNLKVWFED